MLTGGLKISAVLAFSHWRFPWHCTPLKGLGLKVKGSGLQVRDSGFRVQGSRV